MWGFGGRFYWAPKLRVEEVRGIVVAFAWMSSQDRHLKSYAQLYESMGWNSLVCHSQFLNLFFPEKATALAVDILDELVKELKIKPCPVVFASFSGGPKGCMYKVLQIVEGICQGRWNQDDCQLVRDCISGHIYDSSPVDFTSDLGTRFVVHPSVLKLSQPPRIASWLAHGIASGLDALFLNHFESQRAEYWQTLYSSASMRAPYLILCSEDDDLAPYQVICNFAQRLRELGADVKLIKWTSSPHVGHYREHPAEYKAAVTELLLKAAGVYSQRIRQLEPEGMGAEGSCSGNCDPDSKSWKAAAGDRNFQGLAAVPRDHYFLPSSMEYVESGDVASMQSETKEGLLHVSSPPTAGASGVLGQILYNACAPKDVEDWEIMPSHHLNAHRFRRLTPHDRIKYMRRSRL